MNKPIHEVRPGDIVSRDILDNVGRLLFAKGATLTESSLGTLQHFGVESLCVRPAFNPQMADQAGKLARKFYAKQDLSISPGPVLLGLRTEAELRRLENGETPLLSGCPAPHDPVPEPHELPMLCMDCFNPPELPAVVMELRQELGRPEPSNHTVAEIIGRSPGLAIRLLRLVNSPLYGLAGKIDTLQRAVTIVGLREIGMLATGMALIERFGVIPENVVNMRSFLEHCLGCAITARNLAETTGLVSEEQAFVAGLLHDIGRLFFFTSLPERSRFCIDSARKNGRTLMEEEKRYFGLNHAELGSQMLEAWHMPEALRQAVAHHHDPLTTDHAKLAAIVYLADIMIQALGIGTSGECGPPDICPGAMDIIPIAPDQLMDLASAIEDQLATVMAAFQ